MRIYKLRIRIIGARARIIRYFNKTHIIAFLYILVFTSLPLAKAIEFVSIDPLD
jgi:hypothetical protein